MARNYVNQILESVERKGKIVKYSERTRDNQKAKDSGIRIISYGNQPAPRYTITAKVEIKRSDRKLVALASDISKTGIYLQTDSEAFTVGEMVSLTIHAKRYQYPVVARAQIVRRGKSGKFPLGYGLKFLSGLKAVRSIRR
jgi:hypothetical protein